MDIKEYLLAESNSFGSASHPIHHHCDPIFSASKLASMYPHQNEQVRDCNIQFTPQFYNLLKAFFSFGSRRTGRTINLAKILVQIAIETQKKIPFIDHYINVNEGRRAAEHMRSCCMAYVQELEEKGLPISVEMHNEHGMVLSLPARYHDKYNEIIYRERHEGIHCHDTPTIMGFDSYNIGYNAFMINDNSVTSLGVITMIKQKKKLSLLLIC